MPTATDLVTDLPADFEVFGQAVATSMADLLGGTTGQVLSKTSNTDMDFTWVTDPGGDITGVTAGVGITGGGTSGTVTVTNDMATTITTAGDLIYGTGSGTYTRRAIGTTAQVLTVSGGVPTWATPSTAITAAGCSLTKSANQTITNATATAVSFDGENFDTDAYHDNATNNSRITIPTGKGGKYVVSARATFASNITDQRRIQFRVNGSATNIDLFTSSTGVAGEPFTIQTTRFLSLAAADYVEMFVYQASGGNLTLYGDSGAGAGVSFFGAMYLGA